jgi:hypothetical protein
VQDSKSYYKNIHVFCNRIDNLVELYNWTTISKKVDSLLIRNARALFNIVLSSAEKVGCIQNNNIIFFKDAIKKLFRIFLSQAMGHL